MGDAWDLWSRTNKELYGEDETDRWTELLEGKPKKTIRCNECGDMFERMEELEVHCYGEHSAVQDSTEWRYKQNKTWRQNETHRNNKLFKSL